jgi:hypothetical protein
MEDRVKAALGNALIKMESEKSSKDFDVLAGLNDYTDRLIISDHSDGSVYRVIVEKI